MSKTALWVGNAVICGLMASFLGIVNHEGPPSPWLVADLLGAMAGAVGALFGGLLAGYIVTRFMKKATDRSKNVAYFCGVLLWSAAIVFSKMSGS